MARMHSRKKGKAGSKKPVEKKVPSWITYKPKEIEALVIKLGKQDMASAKIGVILRDSYGIPDVKTITKKKISQILKENKLQKNLPEDMTALVYRHIALMKHNESNNHDKTAKRGMQLTESKIKRLAKYYIKKGDLPQGWRYDKNKAKLLVE